MVECAERQDAEDGFGVREHGRDRPNRAVAPARDDKAHTVGHRTPRKRCELVAAADQNRSVQPMCGERLLYLSQRGMLVAASAGRRARRIVQQHNDSRYLG